MTKNTQKEIKARQQMRAGTKWRVNNPTPDEAGKVFQISQVTPDNIAFGYAPGQPGLCGGAHNPAEWIKRVASGKYIIIP